MQPFEAASGEMVCQALHGLPQLCELLLVLLKVLLVAWRCLQEKQPVMTASWPGADWEFDHALAL